MVVWLAELNQAILTSQCKGPEAILSTALKLLDHAQEELAENGEAFPGVDFDDCLRSEGSTPGRRRDIFGPQPHLPTPELRDHIRFRIRFGEERMD